MIFIVGYENHDSTSGFDITGIFDNKVDADSWARSEGMGTMVFESRFGPIDLDVIVPLNKVSWDEE